MSSTKSLGDPEAALTAFLGAAAATAKQAEVGQPDARVSIAFALGWQMAELYRPGLRRSSPAANDRLPGLSRLSTSEWIEIGLDQLQAGVTKLRSSIEAAGLDVPDAQALQAKLATLGAAERSAAIRAFHVELLSTLTAADFRLGKAYGLGRALADTTRDPSRYKSELKQYRVETLCAWIRELATVFPPHTGHAVADSIEAWSAWANAPGANADSKTLGQLRAEGRLWRSLLSAEKQATDMLETSDYVQAAEGLLQRTGALVWSFVRHYGWAVALAVALFGFGVAAMAVFGNPAAIASGAAGVLASIGLSWKGLGSSLGKALAKVEDPLWGAELDKAVYQRITPEAVVKTQRPFRPGPDEPSLAAHA